MGIFIATQAIVWAYSCRGFFNPQFHIAVAQGQELLVRPWLMDFSQRDGGGAPVVAFSPADAGGGARSTGGAHR